MRGFSLLETLVAMAGLSIMMVFLFNLVAQTIRAWEGGNRRVEAAQAARIGLETVAQDLQFALGGSQVGAPLELGGLSKTNIVPFFSVNDASSRIGLPSALLLAPSSGQIFAVAPLLSASNSLHEIGYFSVYVTAADQGEGYSTMRGRRYVLMRHVISGTNSSGNFAYVDALPADQTSSGQWLTENTQTVSQTYERGSLIPNCYQVSFLYATNNNGVLEFVPSWTAGSVLPAGVLVTAKVMDEKTAARVAQLQPNGLTAADVADDSATTVGRVLREGTSEVRRFIPFVNSRN